MVILTEKAEISMEEGDIVRINLKEDVHLLPEDMTELNAAKRELIGSQKHSVLFISGPGSTISKEVLQMMCKKEPLANRTAIAVVVNALAQNYISNFFKTSNTLNLPLMAFSSKAGALRWLKEVVN